MRLTDLQIRKMKVPERGQKTYFDKTQPGFGMRVSQGGSKSFVVVYGKQRKLKTLGRYPEMKLAEARRAFRQVTGELAFTSPDVVSRPSISFEGARERFLVDTATRTKASTTGAYRRLLCKYFEFSKNLDDLTRADIMEVIESLGRVPSERHHAFVAIRTMMNWCHKQGLIEISPVPPLTFKTRARERVLADWELCEVWQHAREYKFPYGRIIQLLILTGQRRGEIAGLRRSWIDGDWIVYPVGFTKNKREHRFPIGRLARQLIDELPGDTDLLFPSRLSSDVPFSGWAKSKRVFDRAINVVDYTLHDLRRTFASTLAGLSTPIHVTERLLNHVSGTVSGIVAVYNRHSYTDEMCEAIDAYDTHLANLVNP